MSNHLSSIFSLMLVLCSSTMRETIITPTITATAGSEVEQTTPISVFAQGAYNTILGYESQLSAP